MKVNLSFLLDTYKVDVVAANQDVATELTSIRPSLQSLSNTRELLSAIESVVGVESTTIKDLITDEVILSSGLLQPEDDE